MIIDDSLVARTALRRMVEAAGDLEVVATVSAAENALEVLRSERVDVILLDWNMPVMTGIEFIRLLRQGGHANQPKVVFCTTENDVAHIRTAMDAGADEYVMKPFDHDTLHMKLQLVGVA